METTDTLAVPQTASPEEAASQLSGISFPELNLALDQSSLALNGSKPSPWERRLFLIGIAGAGAAMLLGTVLPGKAGLIAASLGVLVEVIGLLTSAFLQLTRDWRHFRHARTQHAEEIELGYLEYQSLVQQLRAFPLAQRQSRLRYIRYRQATMHERLGLFTGGMERLGIVPLLVALYLQFKDWQWGDWSSIGSVNFVQGMLAFMLMVAYACFWYLIHLRVRVQAYEQLLSESIQMEEVSP